MLIVSHDRALLNTVCQETVEMKDRQLRCVGLKLERGTEAGKGVLRRMRSWLGWFLVVVW